MHAGILLGREVEVRDGEFKGRVDFIINTEDAPAIDIDPNINWRRDQDIGKGDRPQLEISLPDPSEYTPLPSTESNKPTRGVVVITPGNGDSAEEGGAGHGFYKTQI